MDINKDKILADIKEVIDMLDSEGWRLQKVYPPHLNIASGESQELIVNAKAKLEGILVPTKQRDSASSATTSSESSVNPEKVEENRK